MPILIILQKLAAALRQEFQTRAVIRNLHALDDRLLADIGIERHEIEIMVRKKRSFVAATEKTAAENAPVPAEVADPVRNDDLPMAA